MRAGLLVVAMLCGGVGGVVVGDRPRFVRASPLPRGRAVP
jgi:hypothetical protein